MRFSQGIPELPSEETAYFLGSPKHELTISCSLSDPFSRQATAASAHKEPSPKKVSATQSARRVCKGRWQGIMFQPCILS